MALVNSDVRDKVFNNHLILEHILDYVVHNGDRVDITQVQCCRLVQSSWTKSVNACLRRSREPVFRFVVSSITGRNSLPKIANAVTNSYRLSTTLPPIKVVLKEAIFKMADRKLDQLVLQFPMISQWLVSLFVEMPEDGCPDPAPFSQISLPNLKEFQVKLHVLGAGGVYNEPVNLLDSTNLSVLIQSIFGGSSKLKSFVFNGYEIFEDLDPWMPLGFDTLHLPETLTTLNLKQLFTEEQLESLMKKAVLPRLSSLNIVIPATDDDRPLALVWLWSKLSKTLEKLTLTSADNPDDQYYDDYVFHVPVVMESLKEISIRCINYTWSDDTISAGLDNLLPNLRSVNLGNMEADCELWIQWTKDRRFLQVKHLTVAFPDGEFSLEASRSMCQGFPNVVNLDIGFSEPGMEGLQYIFQHMPQLTNLSIKMRKTDLRGCSRAWDSLLLGLSCELLEVLEREKQFWKCIEFHTNENSILNLTNLQRLCLSGGMRYYRPSPSENPLLSAAVFHFGFHKMPNLRVLDFAGKFTVTRRAATTWKSSGGHLKYRNRVYSF